MVFIYNFGHFLISIILGTNIKVAFSFGGIAMPDTYRMMRAGADIVVGTPSRINHLFFGIEMNEFHKVCLNFIFVPNLFLSFTILLKRLSNL